MSRCKVCDKKVKQAYKATPQGRAKQAWHNLYWRSENRDGRHPHYLKVLLRMTKDEFLAWALPKYTAWNAEYPGVVPSIDRIDPDGHYEIGNLQIIAFKANCGRARRKPATARHIARVAVGLAARWQVNIKTVISEIQGMV